MPNKESYVVFCSCCDGPDIFSSQQERDTFIQDWRFCTLCKKYTCPIHYDYFFVSYHETIRCEKCNMRTIKDD